MLLLTIYWAGMHLAIIDKEEKRNEAEDRRDWDIVDKYGRDTTPMLLKTLQSGKLKPEK